MRLWEVQETPQWFPQLSQLPHLLLQFQLFVLTLHLELLVIGQLPDWQAGLLIFGLVPFSVAVWHQFLEQPLIFC